MKQKYLKSQLIILLAMLLGCPLRIHAQAGKCDIAGKVMDESQLPVAYASVALYNGRTPITGVITDDEGRFTLKTSQTDKEYRLAIEFIGYGKFEKWVTPNTSRIQLGTIILKENAISLGEVVVSAKEVAQKPTIEHTTLHASANLASGKGTAIDILRSSSSVSVSNDVISVRGNSNILVLMDGVPTTATDLSTIPAANIKSIEVITHPDASHDAGGTGGIIHIISKKPKAEGMSGVVSANYGFNHFMTGNVAFSMNKPKASWKFNYNTKYEDDVITSILNRTIKSSGYEVAQEMEAKRYTYNNNLGMGADFRMGAKDRLSVDVKFILPRLNVEQDLHNRFTDKGEVREEYRHNDVTWNRENVEASVAYTHIIQPEVSDFSIKGSVSKIWGHRPSYYRMNGEPVNRSVSGGSPFIPTLQADYKRKFKTGTLTSGVKLTYRRNDIYHRFYALADDEWIYSESMSNDLLHTELVPAAYAMFASRIGKKFTYKAGIRGEFSTVTLRSRHEAIDGRENCFFLAPSLSGTYVVSDNQELSMAVSRRIGRPSYPQLNPYMSMVDATTYEQGNMNLQAEKATLLDVSYQLRWKNVSLFANAYVNHTEGYISQITKMDDGKLITTYVNADKDMKAGLDLSLGVTPVQWMSLSLGANTYHVSTKGKYEGADIANNGWTNNSTFMLDILPWKGGNAQIQYFVTTPEYFPQLTSELTHRMNIGFQQQLMKGALTVSMLFTDVLDTDAWEVSSDNNLFRLKNYSNNKGHMLWLGVSYNFNKFKGKSAQKTEMDRSLIKLGM
jgi:outer membrane receptor protein involved in Fe transport